MTMFLSVAMVGCYSTEEPVGPDVPVVGSLKLSQEEMTISPEGGKFSVDIFTEYSYKTSVNVDWIKITDNSSGDEYCTLYFTIAKNNTTSEREGVITVFCDDYNLSATLTVTQVSNSQIPNNEIWYTSSDSKVVTPNATDVFGANIVSNTYENGQGVITFDGDVTQIGNSAFQQCNSLTSITIPDSVTTIGDSAFVWCYSLTSIIIPDSVTSIGMQAFHQCESLASITIPNSVTSIGWGAFFGCLSLEAFYGKFASEDNRCLIVDGVLTSFAPAGLTEYTILDGVTSIERNTFGYCRKLTKITIPDSVTSIGYFTFSYCTSLKEVYCKPTIPPIGDSLMFNSNATGRKIYVPAASVEAYKAADYWKEYADYIEGYNFENSEVVTPQPANNEIWYTSTDDAVVEPYVTDVFGANIVSNTYENGQGVITFDGDVTQIGNYAFQHCTSLTSITIPNSVTSIGYYAFYSCASLKGITIPDGVTSIGKAVFRDCTSLTTITIPDSVTEIGDGAFRNCSSLTTFYGKFSSADNRCLIVNGVLNSFAIGCGATEYTIPDNVTSIESCAFNHCTSLTSITIPDSVTKIVMNPFQSCSSLTTFYGKFASLDNCCLILNGVLKSFAPGLTTYTIPDSVTQIGNQAFYDCTSLSSITIPDSVTKIALRSFYRCTSLTSVTIPDSITEIGEEAFRWCTSLKEVYCKPLTHPVIVISGNPRWEAFRNNAADRKIYVPAASVEAYKTAKYWSDYADYIFPDTTESSNNQIFYTSSDGAVVEPYATDVFGANIVSNTYENGQGVITFDGDVTQIGEQAFYANSSTSDGRRLTTITIPDSVTSIGTRTFHGCTSLKAFYGKFASADNRCLIVDGVLNSFAIGCGATEYTIPDSVTSIERSAFYDCTSLTSVTIPDSVTSISTYANPFQRCSRLKYFYGKFASEDNHCLIVGNSLSSFAIGCGLKEYTIPNNVISIRQGAFYNCTSLTSVTIPDGVTSIHSLVFYLCVNLKEVYCKPMTPPTGARFMFDNNATGRKIYVPAASVEAYKAADGWSDYADYIVGYDF